MFVLSHTWRARLVVALLLCLFSLAVTLFSLSKTGDAQAHARSVLHTSRNASLPARGPLLYQADWSKGMNGWTGTSQWKTLDGALLSDGTQCCDIVSPYQPGEINNYEVVVKMQAIRGSGFMGMIARASGTAGKLSGYWAGIADINDTGSGKFSGKAAIVNVTDSALLANYVNPISPLVSVPYSPDSSVHIYTMVVEGNHIQLFIDTGTSPIVETTDNTYLSGGKVGLSCGNTYSHLQVTVSSFQVYALAKNGA